MFTRLSTATSRADLWRARFHISAASAVRIRQRYEQTQSLDASKQGRPTGHGKLGPLRSQIIAKVEEHPDITMPDLADWLEQAHGVRVDASNLSQLLCRSGFSYKKTLLAAERARADVFFERSAWKTVRLPGIQASPGRVLFIDETSIKTTRAQ